MGLKAPDPSPLAHASVAATCHGCGVIPFQYLKRRCVHDHLYMGMVDQAWSIITLPKAVNSFSPEHDTPSMACLADPALRACWRYTSFSGSERVGRL